MPPVIQIGFPNAHIRHILHRTLLTFTTQPEIPWPKTATRNGSTAQVAWQQQYIFPRFHVQSLGSSNPPPNIQNSLSQLPFGVTSVKLPSRMPFFVGPFRINIRILPTIPKKAWERFAKRFWRPRQTRSWKQVSSWIFYTKFMLPNCKFSCNFFLAWTFLSHTYPHWGKQKRGQGFVCFFWLFLFVSNLTWINPTVPPFLSAVLRW